MTRGAGEADGTVRARIAEALDGIEREESVRILLAVESGSRAWGFPSRDSDWDVRFLYVRPLASYLSMEPGRDVVERPLVDGLDLSGWDLRKALGQLVRSSAVVLEWLGSPVRYRWDDGVAAALAEVARTAAHLPALQYHYDRLARRSWAGAGTPGEEMRLKSVLYAFRPALALAWMRRHGTPPPMDLPALLAGVPVPEAMPDAVAALLARKAEGVEADMAPCPEAVVAFVSDALTTQVPRPAPWDRSVAVTAADALLLRTVAQGDRA